MMIHGYLSMISTSKLGFNSLENNCERISLYLHSESQKFFIQIGRYSGNPVYSNRKNKLYKDNEGCIAKAWQDDLIFENGFPCPLKQLDQYIDYCKASYNLNKSTVVAINMKSRLYYGVGIKNLTSTA